MLKTKKYRCARCGFVSKQRTNHNGNTWGYDRTNTCPQCPPWAKYPEFGGQTSWECMEAFDDTLQALERAAEYATRKGELRYAEAFMQRAGFLTFGIESVSCAGRSIDYVNLGDTYDATVIEEGGEFSVASWGGWYEETENQHCEDEGEIRCGYCSEFTPCAEEWRDTVCEHCGHYVDGSGKPSPALDCEED